MSRIFEIYVRDTPLLLTDVQGSGLAFSRNDLLIDHSAALELEEVFDYMESRPGHQRIVLRSSDPETTFQLVQSHFTIVRAAGGAVWSPDRRLLMIYRNQRWDLPKGKAEAGETARQTALREVQEECGIRKLEILRPLMATYHTYRNRGKRYLKETQWMEMRNFDPEALQPQQEEGITHVSWARIHDIPQRLRNTYPNIVRLLTVCYPELNQLSDRRSLHKR